MGDFFGGLRSGIQFPQVVMNQGPLPGSGGLPAPLHETPDARINYGSSLLGDLTPYAYGEPGYLSSQNAYLNIPHKIQKIVPVVYLPEARRPAKDLVDVSHPVDDADIAFVLRLNRNSMFCTGLKNSAMRRAGLGTAIDPLINLCTLNYILSGMQMGVDNTSDNLWVELLMNLDKERFGRHAGGGRDYVANPIKLSDIIHVVRSCIRPFGIVRGSEKQGGQDQATISPATWPVSFIVSLTIDGKEANVLNIWHHHELHAGNDLVLRLKPMPVRPYTLNHYYKSVKRQTWDGQTVAPVNGYVWQLVPDLLTLEAPGKTDVAKMDSIFRGWPVDLTLIDLNPRLTNPPSGSRVGRIQDSVPWQELGYWHVGRSQIQTGKYGEEEYWHNDLANNLRTNHLDITFQPIFQVLPSQFSRSVPLEHQTIKSRLSAAKPPVWKPSLRLEKLEETSKEASPPAIKEGLPGPDDVLVELTSAERVRTQQADPDDEPDWLGRLDFADDGVAPASSSSEPPAPLVIVSEDTAGAGNSKKPKVAKRGRGLGGSLLKADGTSEASLVGLL